MAATQSDQIRKYISIKRAWLDKVGTIVDAEKVRTDCDIDQMSASLRELIDILTEEGAPLALISAAIVGSLASVLDMDAATAVYFSVFEIALGQLADGVSLDELPVL